MQILEECIGISTNVDKSKIFNFNETSLECCECCTAFMEENNVYTGVFGCCLKFWSAKIAENESNGHVHVKIQASVLATDRNVDFYSSVMARE